jgi:hypothetical protein
MLLTFSGNIEAVDNGDRRTISGKIAPYGEVGNDQRRARSLCRKLYNRARAKQGKTFNATR